jgi:hypothetical protein
MKQSAVGVRHKVSTVEIFRIYALEIKAACGAGVGTCSCRSSNSSTVTAVGSASEPKLTVSVESSTASR